MKLNVLDEVASTNEVVKNALREGKAEGLIVRRAACTCPSSCVPMWPAAAWLP